MEVISRPLFTISSIETQRLPRSLFDCLPRTGSVLPVSMVQHGHELATGPSHNSHYDDRGAPRGRQEYDSIAVTPAQPENFGRAATYLNSPSLFPASTPSYDHTSPGLRGDALPHPVLGIHSPQQDAPQSLNSYNDYTQYAQTSAHVGQSSQGYQHQHQQYQPSHAQQNQHHAQQHHSPHHQFHHTSEQQMTMQSPNDLVSSQAFRIHHPHASYALHSHSHHLDHAQSSYDVPRRGKNAEPAEQHTPRPPNAWILYRSQKFREIQQSRDAQAQSGASEKPKSQAEISKLISQMWQNEIPTVKQRFEALADEKKLAHQRMYPTYRYRPKKKVNKNAKQSAASQTADQRQPADSQGSGRGGHGSFAGEYQDRFASEGHAPERRGGNDSQRTSTNQSVSSLHDVASRDPMPRRSNLADRRERNELQMPVNYGRQVSGSVASADGQSSSSYSSNRMHPYGDRPSSLLRHDSARTSELFREAGQPTSSTYAGSQWAASDGMGGSSSSTYYDGARGGSSYASLGNTRMATSSMMMGPTVGGGPSVLSFSPSLRQSVPSQQLQHPLDPMDSNLGLAELASGGGAPGYGGGGGGFRTTPLSTQSARFGASFGEARPEVPSGLAVSGNNNDGLPEPFDPHRRL